MSTAGWAQGKAVTTGTLRPRLREKLSRGNLIKPRTRSEKFKSHGIDTVGEGYITLQRRIRTTSQHDSRLRNQHRNSFITVWQGRRSIATATDQLRNLVIAPQRLRNRFNFSTTSQQHRKNVGTIKIYKYHTASSTSLAQH